MRLEPTIGLELHAQLATKAKLFCACPTEFGAAPNSHTCPVCLGLPGALPTVNAVAVRFAVRAASALGATVHPLSGWARKSYFYPDLPKGYQITQYERPLATGGQISFEVDGAPCSVSLTRVHLEEDAGKSRHDAVPGRSLVDLNRAGVPLIEIVSAPELKSGAEAATFMKAVRALLRSLRISDGNLEAGSLRCDANVSLREAGASTLGTRTEIKNLNSFRFVAAAIDFEIARQRELLMNGGAVVQETRLYDPTARVTRRMRGKEGAHDYRYFPEPDLPALLVPDPLIAEERAGLPELPAAKRIRYVTALGLTSHDAQLLSDDPELSDYFETALAVHANAKGIANWMLNELMHEVGGRSLAETALPAAGLAELVRLIDDGKITGKLAKEILPELVARGGSVAALIERRGGCVISDRAAIEALADDALAAHQELAERYRAGKSTLYGFFVGEVLRASGGRAAPSVVNEVLRRKLGAKG